MPVKEPPFSSVSLAAVGRKGLEYLARECAKEGWDVVGAYALIAEESGWKVDAKNPGASASGLIQVIDATAKSLGFKDAEAVRRLSGYDQLKRVAVPYWRRMSKVRKYTGPISFFLWGVGGGTQSTDPDGTQVLHLATSPGAKANPVLRAPSGAITVGSCARYFAPFCARANQLPRLHMDDSSGWGKWVVLAGLAYIGWSWFSGDTGNDGRMDSGDGSTDKTGTP